MLNENELSELIKGSRENEYCEFKEAYCNFNNEKLFESCVAISNVKGGFLIFGVTDKKPRRIIGTNAYQNINKIKKSIYDSIKLRINIVEYYLDGKRILVFEIPCHMPGRYNNYNGKFLTRCGESTEAMSWDDLNDEFKKQTPDFSALNISDANIDDLDEQSIDYFISKWTAKENGINKNLSKKQLLTDAGLINNNNITYASLIMMGKEKSIQKLLGHSETIFEYRSEKSRIEPDKRIEFKKGFLGYLEEICNVIELYNKKQQIRGDNLFITEIPTFRMNVIREALLNAFCHRDYRDGNSINIKLTSSSLDIISPGGLPEGIDIDNIIDQTNPRNRLIAESLQKCGLVERAGQGYDMMWKSLLKDSKNGPDLSNTTSNQVHLSIQGHVLDPNFIQYIDQLTNFDISIHELITLWHICTGQQIKKNHCNTDTIKSLKQKRLIENIGYGKGTKYILSREYYVTANKRGEYSRNKGLPDAENKLLILQHIKDHGQGKMQDFEQLLQNINRTHIQTLLRQLKIEGKIKHVGSNKTGMWIIC